MNKELQGSLYYLFSNLRFSLFVFWGVLMGVLAISLISVFLIEDRHARVNLALPIYVYAGICGKWIVINGIPYMIKMRVTRIVIIAAIGIFGSSSALIVTLISTVVDQIVSWISASHVLN